MSLGPTPHFDALGRDGFRLYRGSSGSTGRAIMRAAVGPVRAAAEHIRDKAAHLIDPADSRQVFKFFTRFFCGPITVAMPHQRLADNLDMLMQRPRVMNNLYTSFEHVVWESPINAPFTGRQLESVSIDPRIAVLYAYGIDTDAWHSGRIVKFYRSQPNTGAFVAVLDRAAESRLAIIHATNVYGGPGLSEDEAKRRVQRDGEVLLEAAETPSRLIDLPAFDPKDPAGSLEAAAEHLIKNGVAVGPPTTKAKTATATKKRATARKTTKKGHR